MSYPARSKHKIMIFLTVFTMLLAVSPPTLSAQPEIPAEWSSRQAVVFALQNSPDSRIAAQRIAAADSIRQEAASAFRPRLNLSADYSQTDNPMYSFGNILNQGSFNNNIDFNEPGRTDALTMKAEVLYRFYNGGRDTASRDAAESSYAASEQEQRRIEHQLGFEVLKAFQEIVQARDQVEARRAELEAIDAALKVARARYEAGDLLKADMLNFEVQKARASENLIISRHRKELSEKVFLNLLGLEEGAVTLVKQEESFQHVPEKGAYRERPEVTALSEKLTAAEANLAKAEGGRYPTLDGFASYQYDQGYVLDGSGDSWSAGLKLNYQLYDGQQNSALIARRKAELNEIKEQLLKLKLAINLDLQQAELNFKQADERRSVTDKMVQVARESAQLSRERFREGVILTSDLIDTEQRLTDALVRQSAARANYRIAIANVRRAAGYQQFTVTTEELLETKP